MAYYRTSVLNNDKNMQTYIIGLAVGNGNLSKINKTIRLRITCDDKYPVLKRRIFESLQKLLPQNKVNEIYKGKGCSDVCVYSNHLENLLGWQADEGSKFIQNISTPKWIFRSDEYKAQYLKGLIETDGSVYYDRSYPMATPSSFRRRL